ncbi:MAG: hypothetical protein EA366_02945, partial [Spirulina sp. DLM2.Bin59]
MDWGEVMAEDQQTPSNVSKSEAIAQIQQLIHQLQGVAAQLEADPAEDWQQGIPLDDLTQTVAQWTAAIAPTNSAPTDAEPIDSAPIAPEPKTLPSTATPPDSEDWGQGPEEDDS